jgi:hypothetical protein
MLLFVFERNSTILHLRTKHMANKARNRPCSISRAERKADWPKFFATFRQYTCPMISAPMLLWTSAEGDHKKTKRGSAPPALIYAQHWSEKPRPKLAARSCFLTLI